MEKKSPIVNINPNLKGLGISATVAINDRSNQLRAQAREIYKLGLGESPLPLTGPVAQASRDAGCRFDHPNPEYR